jgi:hypothetical protein
MSQVFDEIPVGRFDSVEDVESESLQSDDLEFVVIGDSLPRARTNVETVLGICAAFFIGLPAPLIATVAVAVLPWPNFGFPVVLSLIVLLSTGYLQLTVVHLAARAIEGDDEHQSFLLQPETARARRGRRDSETYIPLPMAMAIRLPNWWAIFRPLIAIWWAAHFVVAAVFGHMTAKQVNGMNNASLGTVLISLGLMMAFLLAANLYLMLAIAVAIPKPRIWLIAWQYRFIVDLVITATIIAST